MLDRGKLLDAEPDGRLRGQPGREPVGDLGRGPDGLLGQRHQALVERGRVHGQHVKALSQAERHCLNLLVEDRPPAPEARLDASPPEHQRAAVLVRELLVRVEAPLDPHIATGAGGRQVARFGQGDRRRHREEAADADPRAVGAQEERADRDRDDPGGDHEQGGHGRGW